MNILPIVSASRDDDGYLCTAIKAMPIVSKPRQLLPKVFYYNGGITSFYSSQLPKDNLFERVKLIPLFITEQEILDIDTKMIYEDELPAWKVSHVISENDEYVKFAFECNECTSHDNTTEIEVETSLTK